MLNLQNRLHFLLEEAGEPTTTSSAVDNPEPTETAPVNTSVNLADLVSDEAAKEFLGKSTYDADALVKLAMDGQVASTPVANFRIGDISDRLSKEHKMEPEAIRSFLNDESFMKGVLADVKNANANQAVADNFLVGAIKDMYDTEKGAAEQTRNKIIKNFGTEEDYNTTINKLNTAQEVIPKDSRVDPKHLDPAQLKTFMLLLDGKAFNTDALPGKGVLDKPSTGFTGRDGKSYSINGDADYATLSAQLKQIPSSDKRQNPDFDKFFNDLVKYRQKNGYEV